MVIAGPTAPCICCHTSWSNIARKQASSDILQGSVTTYLRWTKDVTKLRKVCCWVCQYFLISEHLAKLQARRCVHFLRLLAVWWPCVQRVRDNHLLAYNCANYSPILIFFTDRLGNKHFVIWISTSPPHLKYVATLPCNLSLLACFWH